MTECPEEVREAVLEILEQACLSIRAAGWNSDAGYCAVEADHIHNLPGLLLDYTPEKLRYYLEIERPAYLHEAREAPWKNVQAYEPLWLRMEHYLPSKD